MAFAKKRGRPAKAKSEAEKPVEEPVQETPKEPETEAPQQEKTAEQNTESQDDKSQNQQNSEQQEESKEDDEETKGDFKLHRKIGFFFMEVSKYAFWAWLALFIYHYIMLKKKEDYKNSGMVIPIFCQWAEKFNYHVQGISMVLTRPPIEQLLPDPPPLPPGAVWPKTLVLNMRGTLVHSEYKFGEGFEFKKRPNLNLFLE